MDAVDGATQNRAPCVEPVDGVRDFDRLVVNDQTFVLNNKIRSGSYSTIFRVDVDGTPAALRLTEATMSRQPEHAPVDKRWDYCLRLDESGLAAHASVSDLSGVATLCSWGRYRVASKRRRYKRGVWSLMRLYDEDLMDALQKQAPHDLPSLSDVVEFVESLGRVLGSLHANGWVHLDVKPENLLRNQGAPLKESVLIDFGLATRLDGDGFTKTSVSRGSTFYMAPEVAAGGCACPKSDAYALGMVTMFLMLWALRGDSDTVANKGFYRLVDRTETTFLQDYNSLTACRTLETGVRARMRRTMETFGASLRDTPIHSATRASRFFDQVVLPLTDPERIDRVGVGEASLRSNEWLRL